MDDADSGGSALDPAHDTGAAPTAPITADRTTVMRSDRPRRGNPSMLRGVRRVLQTRLNACPRRPAGDKPQQARRGVEPAGSGWLWVDASRQIALDIKAAVDVQDMPGDEVGIVGTQVRHRTGDVGRLPDALEG